MQQVDVSVEFTAVEEAEYTPEGALGQVRWSRGDDLRKILRTQPTPFSGGQMAEEAGSCVLL